MQPILTPDQEALVVLALDTPQAGLPLSRAQTDAETQISQLRILVFEQVQGEYLFRDHAALTETDAPEGQQFKARLKPSGGVPLKLMVLANSESTFFASAIGTGATEAQVRAQINASFTDAGITGALPMYGEIVLEGGLSPSSTNVFTVTMLRSVARVDVVLDLAAGSPQFTLDAVYAFRAYDKIQLIPDALSSSTTVGVTAPSIPAGAQLLDTPVVKAGASPQQGSIIQLYIPESAAAQTPAERLNGTTTIVVGGRFGGGDNPVTYYRTDLNTSGQVLRNHRYTVKIIKVGLEGWETPELAANNYSSAVQTDVQDWEDFSTDLYWHGSHLALSSRSIALPFVGGRTGRIDVESSIPSYQIQWLDAGGAPVGRATSALNDIINTERFEVKIVKDPADGETVTHLSFRTREDNYTGPVIAETLLLTAGSRSVRVVVSQDNPALYSTRHFDVLSGYSDYGTFGHSNQAPTAPTGAPMRMLLHLYFSPGGTVGIGGFNFDYLTVYTGTSALSLSVTESGSASNYSYIKRMIELQDVIYLPYLCNPSEDVTNLLLAWLAADTRRVLIVDAETAATTTNVRSRLTEDGTWSFSSLTSVATDASGYLRANSTPGSDPFFNGPFGAVSAGGKMTRGDGVFGYNTSYTASGNVIPLIMGGLNTDAMIFGVNPSRRIVYTGDVTLFYMGMGNDANFSYTWNDQNRLMGNVWAWITTQLIYGDDLHAADYAQ